ncbi:hypothetical protein [Marinovum sp.]|uniref:hypothetical protein n=1 Tax=Marinovum sp. TaxID=2024839 RepID=UPI002B2684C0|nr:hypothetical protein [Marinovum sp.]
MGLFGFGKSAGALPDLGALPVEQAIARLRALPAAQMNRAAGSVLYSARARPAALDDQIALFDAIAALPGLAAHHRANARIARSHKALELGDAAALSAGLPALLALGPEIAGFPPSDDIRQDRCHVTFSRAYVGLNAALMLGDGALLSELMDEALAAARHHLDAPLPGGFYRSSANVMRCLAFALVARRHGTEPAQRAALATLAQQVFSRALDLRPPAGRSTKARKVATGIPMPDAEFMRTAALAQLLTRWAEASAGGTLDETIGALAVAQRTPDQRDRLSAAWQAQRQ